MTYRVTWPVDSFACATFGYPTSMLTSDDAFGAMAMAEQIWTAECTEAGEDPDYVTPEYTWHLVWSDRGKRDAIRLYVDCKATDIRVEPAPAHAPANNRGPHWTSR